MQQARALRRDDSRVILHFDYDCFYASVVENETPALKSLPLAIQQKQIVVTCNYEARRRGLRKMQLITEAKRDCPDVVIILGEDLTRFRNVSKELYYFLRDSIWSGRAERLGFDEVWLDCTDMVNYNIDLLNQNDLTHSFFCIDKDDPTVGFEYDASTVAGPQFPVGPYGDLDAANGLGIRLALGSHLAQYLRHQLENGKGYTSTVGVSTSKILSKLAGNINKPKNQTTLMPPYEGDHGEGNVIAFMDPHEIRKVPGIGFKLAQKVRARVLGKATDFSEGFVYGAPYEAVSVRDVRTFPGMGPEMLEGIFAGPGSQRGIGGRVWALLNGIDDSEVGKARRLPSQISQEDSYMKYIHTFEAVRKQLLLLAERLLRRMHIDLTEEDDFEDPPRRRWLAHPRTLRLATRPRPPRDADSSRGRSVHRISRSGPMPNFALSFTDSVDALAERLVETTLVPMFRKLHPEATGWHLSLINVAVTNMAETAAESKDSEGRDIGRMFRQQDDVLKHFKVTEPDSPSYEENGSTLDACQIQTPVATTADGEDWTSDEDDEQGMHACSQCGLTMPTFAAAAHSRYHAMS